MLGVQNKDYTARFQSTRQEAAQQTGTWNQQTKRAKKIEDRAEQADRVTDRQANRNTHKRTDRQT